MISFGSAYADTLCIFRKLSFIELTTFKSLWAGKTMALPSAMKNLRVDGKYDDISLISFCTFFKSRTLNFFILYISQNAHLLYEQPIVT